MKKIFVLLICSLLLILSGCGMSAEAKQVSQMIDAIEDVTLDSEEAILAAEKAYEALTDEQKAEIGNYVHLSNARILYDEMKQQADYEALKASLIGDWVNLADAEDIAISVKEDGTAQIGGFSYDWTLNPNMETIRFEGDGKIVFEVRNYDGLLCFVNPYLMTCVKRADYIDLYDTVFVTRILSKTNADQYFGDAVDVGAIRDAEGKETADRLFAFHSNAYDSGLIFFNCSPNFVISYNAGRNLHGAIYEPYCAVSYRNPNDLPNLKITDAAGSINFVRAEYVASVTYDPDTAQRIITLTNGLSLITKCVMNPTVNGNTYNGYGYLADPNFAF